jgi:hypothetical protein
VSARFLRADEPALVRRVARRRDIRELGSGTKRRADARRERRAGRHGNRAELTGCLERLDEPLVKLASPVGIRVPASRQRQACRQDIVRLEAERDALQADEPLQQKRSAHEEHGRNGDLAGNHTLSQPHPRDIRRRPAGEHQRLREPESRCADGRNDAEDGAAHARDEQPEREHVHVELHLVDAGHRRREQGAHERERHRCGEHSRRTADHREAAAFRQ